VVYCDKESTYVSRQREGYVFDYYLPLNLRRGILSFRDFNAIDSFLVMSDVEGFDFSNTHQILQLNSTRKAGGSVNLEDSATHSMSKLLVELSVLRRLGQYHESCIS
jgi:hypothetical protein